MNKVLITGSTGLVGSEAVDFFTEKGWEVFGIDNNMRSYFFGTPKKKSQYDIDIRDEKAINRLFKENLFDVIIHTAAQPSHDWAKKEPLTDFDINARATLILLEATRTYCPNATFIFCSTDKVYGENMIRQNLVETPTRWHHEEPYDESLSIDQSMHSLFGCSKAAADLLVQEYGYYFNINTACFRCGCITGRNHEGAEEHGFLAYLAKCIKNNIKYRIFGYKGKQVRDIIHAYDLVNAFWHVVQNPMPAKVYNMGGGAESSCSILEAITMIEQETGNKAITEYIDTPRMGDRQWDIHDVSNFKRDYPGWDYEFSLNTIIKELCQ